MRKLKVVTVVGTRPEIIRLSRLIPKLDEYTDHIFVHTGQNFDSQLSDVFFKDLELRQPDHYLNVDTSSFATVMADTLRKSEELFRKEKPDAVMVLGDTNSAVAAIVAERLHIPVYHMEAGNRSFDKNVPEELNRRMIDHVATFNLVYTEHARSNLLREGISPRFIFKTGSPMREVIEFVKPKLAEGRVLERLNLVKDEYFLVSLHRQENVDSAAKLQSAITSLADLSSRHKLPIVFSLHPRTRSRLQQLNLALDRTGISFFEPFGFLDYLSLQISSKCVISDSGSISEESSIANFPSVTWRDSMERPEALELGRVVLGNSKSDLVQGVERAVSFRGREIPDGYETDDFSDRVTSLVIGTARIGNDWAARSVTGLT